MPRLETIDSEQFTARNHPVTMPHGGWSSLYASTERKPRVGAPVPEKVVFERRPDEFPSEIVAAQEVARQAHAALAEAKSQHEDYKLQDASPEAMIAMTHAINSYGPLFAEQSGTDPIKVDMARVQLTDAMGERIQGRRPEDVSVDSATFMLTAISLAMLRQSTDDSAEKAVADTALDSLRKAGGLERIKLQEALGPHTGELAVAAILEHEFAAH